MPTLQRPPNTRPPRPSLLSPLFSLLSPLFSLLLIIPAIAQTQPTPHTSLPNYLLGADISWVQEDESNGATYYDHGLQKDPFQILHDHGFNAIRLRVFVNPASPHGYAAHSKQPFCDANHTLAMAQRARAFNMALLIDFHYSDTWADPGKQTTPAAWQNLDLPALEQAVYDHTHAVLTLLKDHHCTPDMVQIGNETTNGMLWPTGRAKDHFDNFAALLNSGIAATRAVDPRIKIVLHNDKGANNPAVRWWLDNLLAHHVTDFDVIGLSCNTDGPVEKWQANFSDLATRYPQYALLAAEYSYHKRQLNDILHNLPNHRGLGTFIWEPTRHHQAVFSPRPTPPTTRPTTTQPTHRPRTGPYDTNPYLDLYDQMAHDYGLTQ